MKIGHSRRPHINFAGTFSHFQTLKKDDFPVLLQSKQANNLPLLQSWLMVENTFMDRSKLTQVVLQT